MKYMDNELATISLDNLAELQRDRITLDLVRVAIKNACEYRNGEVDYISSSRLLDALKVVDPSFVAMLRALARSKQIKKMDEEAPEVDEDGEE